MKASEQMHAVASEQQQKEANIKEALEEQLAQVRLLNLPFNSTLLRFKKPKRSCKPSARVPPQFN